MPLAPIRDILMYYEDAGSGEPLVLISGLGSDLQAWRFQVADLARSFRVITLDNRGAGRSSAPDRPYTIAAMAADTAALLRHLGVQKASVLGWSMGGLIAQELAASEPGLVGRLILVATTADVDGAIRTLVQGFADIRRSNLSREQQVRVLAPWLYSRELLDDEPRFNRSVENALANPYPAQDHAYVRQCQAILAWHGGVASKIACPTLVVAAAEDIAFPRRHAEQLAKAVSGAKLIELPGGHAGIIEHPREYNAGILDFFAAPVPA